MLYTHTYYLASLGCDAVMKSDFTGSKQPKFISPLILYSTLFHGRICFP